MIFDCTDTEIQLPSERTMRNRKRGNKISSYARMNVKTYKELDAYLMQMNADNPAFDYVINLRSNLQNCCQHTLVREHLEPKTYEFIAAHTCKHKMCHVCNAERSRVLRRKYARYIDANEFVDRKTGEVFTRDDFDFMHLTLTVPHGIDGYRGKRWYSDELVKEFNYMRKMDFWKYFVFAGEFGVEVTKKENGLHIHIHALLVVHKSEQNRNLLHREILTTWNRLTANGQFEPLPNERLEAIKKGNKQLTATDLMSLNANGSTMVSLESLFVYNATKTHGTDRWNSELGKWKHYVDVNDKTQLISGILECIKYHFEPLCMNKADGSYDFYLMCEILPAIKGKPLYRKFGNFHGVKELNIIDNSNPETVIDDMAETANDEVLHPVTNEPLQAGQYRYVVIQAKRLFYDRANHLKPVIKRNSRKHYLKSTSLAKALLEVTKIGISDSIRHKIKDKEHLEIYANYDDTQPIF